VIENLRLTTACVVFREGRYLLVEERDKVTGRMVFNQPAGHLETGESIIEGAIRETREETGYLVSPSGFISMGLYSPPERPLTYLRVTLLAEIIDHVESARLDPDIHAIHWLNYDQIRAQSDKLRSPMVLDAVERHRSGQIHSLNLIATL
jgi:8-oxo-dGTP pyrophosphatase MutT (NUDIX family)